MRYYLGAEVAWRRAGPWPTSGTIVDYELAASRAFHAAHRTADLEWRYVRRWPYPAYPPWSPERATYFRARREKAIDIAELRLFLLNRLLHEDARGAA